MLTFTDVLAQRKLLVALVFLGGSSPLAAAPLTPAEEPPLPIFGGDAVEECGWPSTVMMDGCTGTLVHPQVAIFASHCMFFADGVGPETVGFGEHNNAPVREVATDGCLMFDGWTPDMGAGEGNDVAFCVLAEPVDDVDIVPILMGCETEILQPGQDVALVGFGVTETDVFGVKHQVAAQVNSLTPTEINLGGNGMSTCNGDSGGPAFVQLEDGSWRVFGVTSRGLGGGCGEGSVFGLIHAHIDWIEAAINVDLTPCHDADGTWNPNEDCGAFPLEPNIPGGDWALGCAGGGLSRPSSTCGDPFVADDDTGTSTGTSGGEGTGESSSGGDADNADGTSTGQPEDLGTSTGDVATDGTAAQATDDDATADGCSCRAHGSSAATGWLALGLLGLFVRRRQ